MVTSGDPVHFGFVTSLAHPGGNITGSSNFAPELSAKRLELLAESFPRRRRIAVLFNPENWINERNIPVMEETAKLLNLTLQRFELRTTDECRNVFSAMTTQRT
jgi:putative tryptophan/tyrosine transport system substrate-binding protein